MTSLHARVLDLCLRHELWNPTRMTIYSSELLAPKLEEIDFAGDSKGLHLVVRTISINMLWDKIVHINDRRQ
jgi:hypothetical protein